MTFQQKTTGAKSNSGQAVKQTIIHDTSQTQPLQYQVERQETGDEHDIVLIGDYTPFIVVFG